MSDEQDRPGPDEGYKPGKDDDTEGHKRFVREGGPDEAARGKGGATDDDDTEGHKRDADPDGLGAGDGPDAPGPEKKMGWSDRNRKTGIVPVEW